MYWRKRFEREANEISDPLERRIFIRSQHEHRREATRGAIVDGAIAGARSNGGALFGIIAIYFCFIVWAVIHSIWEELRDLMVRKRNRLRKRQRRRSARIVTHYREV